MNVLRGREETPNGGGIRVAERKPRECGVQKPGGVLFSDPNWLIMTNTVEKWNSVVSTNLSILEPWSRARNLQTSHVIFQKCCQMRTVSPFQNEEN